MEVEIDDIVKDVLRILDENEDILQEKIEFGIPGSNLQEVIREEIESVATECILSATAAELNESKEYNADVDWEGIGRGVVALPSDFLRLVSFRMSDWKRTITKFMEYGSDTYNLRFHPRSSRRGIRISPAVSLHREGSCVFLEFIGSSDPGAYVERFSYIPRPDTSKSNTLWLPSALVDRIARTCAERLRR